MYEKNLVADMDPPRMPSRTPTPQDAGPVDWLGIYNQHHQVGTWELHVPTRRLTWSAETYRIHGLDPRDTTVPLKAALALFHPADIAKVEQLMAQAIRTKRGYRYVLRLQRPDKQARVIESIASVRLDEEGEVERIVGVVQDITNQVQHENTRTGQTDLLLRMVRTQPGGAALLDREMRYIAWSPRWLTDLGLPVALDLAGKKHFEVLPDVGPDRKVYAEVIMRGHALDKERAKVRLSNGVIVLVDWVIQPWQDRYGEIGGAVMMTNVYQATPPRQEQAAEPQGSAADMLSTMLKVEG